jgi:hypothetical protein
MLTTAFGVADDIDDSPLGVVLRPSPIKPLAFGLDGR